MVGNDRHAPGNVLQFVIRGDCAIFNHAFHRRVNMLGPVFLLFQGAKLSVTVHCNTNVNGAHRLGNTGKATFRKTLLGLFAHQRSLFAFRQWSLRAQKLTGANWLGQRVGYVSIDLSKQAS